MEHRFTVQRLLMYNFHLATSPRSKGIVRNPANRRHPHPNPPPLISINRLRLLDQHPPCLLHNVIIPPMMSLPQFAPGRSTGWRPRRTGRRIQRLRRQHLRRLIRQIHRIQGTSIERKEIQPQRLGVGVSEHLVGFEELELGVASVDGIAVVAGVGGELAAVDGDGGQGEGAVAVFGVGAVLPLNYALGAGGVGCWRRERGVSMCMQWFNGRREMKPGDGETYGSRLRGSMLLRSGRRR